MVPVVGALRRLPTLGVPLLTAYFTRKDICQ